MLTSSTQEDSLTLKIADIIKTSNNLRKRMSKEQAQSQDITGANEANTLLQIHLATYFDNENVALPKSEFKTGGKTTKSVSERLKGKPGRIRGNLMGKRQNYCARSVITCDPNLSIDEVGIPLKVAKNLTVPEIVTPQNIEHLSNLIRNGDSIYPGANFVTKQTTVNGKTVTQRVDLRIRKKAIKLNFGDIVDRHLVDGDYVLFNRQPSLHKPSMMGHRVRVARDENINTFRISVNVTQPYNKFVL
jgi:DNA-directed RNA polymerase II subunit RPB1